MIDAFEEMKKMREEMNRLFESTFGVPRLPRQLSWKGGIVKQPETDLQETDKEIIAVFDLPGVDKGNINLHVDRDSITVRAEKKTEKEEKKKGYVHQERAYTSFCRSFVLPKAVIPEKAEAEYKDGVLTVRMPKKEISAEKRKGIEVKIK
ncbi:MAG: Hsp20/alpha crystallin family protein [Nanoarchaeota archaeon]